MGWGNPGFDPNVKCFGRKSLTNFYTKLEKLIWLGGTLLFNQKI